MMSTVSAKFLAIYHRRGSEMNKEIKANALIDKADRIAGFSSGLMSLHLREKEEVSVISGLIYSAILFDFI